MGMIDMIDQSGALFVKAPLTFEKRNTCCGNRNVLASGAAWL
jgi:hypothetical protein